MSVKKMPPGRAAARTAAIISATHTLLREVGYEQLSIDAVAARAGASKTTIYRRWPDKRSLVCAALLDRSKATAELPATAVSLREDLIALVTALTALAAQEDTPGFVSLLAAAQKDPVIADTLRGGALATQQRNCRDVVQRAIGRGELKDPAVTDVLFDLILGRALVRHMIQGRPFSVDAQTEFVDTVLLPVLHAGGQGAWGVRRS
ncbi:TetR/AcrR family transcriptional regulator [Streptomyces sp. LP11]|uniref:TetR/AcrR family transcriptional regulator n=1 Tax=Streptomyces pyxinicus TaxID=2970331 RepID=A0ABT2ATZ4_9ACTN|nr:TetR/AcrR family transcriptional regulator [Streptomyces sp. LP11]MCS0599717.1 TetR/AcrR family transcriptional regulator [Streptomyces sp. LP11]